MKGDARRHGQTTRFVARRPDRLWVADFNMSRNWEGEGVSEVAFVSDVFSGAGVDGGGPATTI